MFEFAMSTRFRRDYKRLRKRGYDLSLLERAIADLLAGKPLAARYRDHALTGDFAGLRECHITPDWLLLYKRENDILLLTAMRTGTHADVFGA